MSKEEAVLEQRLSFSIIPVASDDLSGDTFEGHENHTSNDVLKDGQEIMEM